MPVAHTGTEPPVPYIDVVPEEPPQLDPPLPEERLQLQPSEGVAGKPPQISEPMVQPPADKPFKWASVFPQAGGMDYGFSKALKSEPSFFIVDRAFSKNQVNVSQLFPDTPQFYLEEDVPAGLTKDLDVVTCVAPCAGLTTLNAVKTGAKKPGPDAVQNQWLLGAAEMTLKDLKPVVHIGENAPKLFTAFGAKVAKKLAIIGEKYGYSFSMFKTCTSLHGIPQTRQRTFYCYWRSPYAPVLDWIKEECPSLKEYLSRIPEDASLQDSFVLQRHSEPPSEFLPYKFYLQKTGHSHKSLVGSLDKTRTVFQLIQESGLLEECQRSVKAETTRLGKLCEG